MDKQNQIEKTIQEMECINCVHAPICFAQKGGVNLQLINSTNCCYYQPKLPEGSIVLTEEEFNAFRQTIITQSQEYTKLCDEMNDKIIKARKETAREIINYINTEIRNYISDSDLVAFNELDIKWLKNKFGLE